MAIAHVRGVRINHEVLGTQGPWVALVTGGRRGYEEFVSLAGRIAREGYRVLLHDRRNTGASEVVIEGEDGEEQIWADDLVILLKQLGATSAWIGGGSSGARISMLTYMRHPEFVRGLLLMRVTGGDFAAGRLPEMYYAQFIRAAQTGGMAAVCATEQVRERIAANPSTGERLMAMDPARYIAVMSHWLEIFTSGPKAPVMGITEAELRAFRVPTIIIPGNDMTHASASSMAAQKLIPGAELFALPITDQDIPLIPFTQWAEHEPAIAGAYVDFMRRTELQTTSGETI
jgi:pimeloyl-ACP methyl ester carboxylesterase